MTSRRTLPGAGGLTLSRLIVLACTIALSLPPGVAPVLAQPAKPARPAANANDAVMLNFVNADIDAVVRAIGQFTGKTFVVDPRVKGTLSLVTERPVTREQAFEQLLTALRLQGFTIVQTGNVARVLPEADAKLQGGAVVSPPGAAPRGDQLITQVFRLRYESATAMVPILRPLIAPNNTIAAYPQNNTLVITDYADNLRRIQRIIESIDTPATSDVEIIQIKYGLAMEIATVVNRVLDEGARAAGQAVDAGQRISVLAEPRTNSLILRAPSPARLALAKNLIAHLDKPALTPGNINVVYLRNAEAVRLAPLLRAIIGSDPSYVPQAPTTSGLSPTAGTTGAPGMPTGGQQPAGGLPTQAAPAAPTGAGAGGPLAGMIQADSATNSLIITAPEPLYRNIRAIIDKLDVRRAQVVIESLIVEVSADKAAEFGIQWQTLGGNLNDPGTNVFGGTNFGSTGQNIVGAAQNIGSLGQGLNVGIVQGTVNIPGIGEVVNLAFLARALETKADANILSTPTIQTLDNEEAKFLVGQNIPLITGSYASTGANGGAGVNPFQTFERRDIGLQLRVRPQISEGGVVRLAIYQELSSIQNTLTAAQGGIITNKRSFESVVLVEDGNIVVLGGLIEDRTDNSKSSVPVLGDIPVLGQLFRYENRGRKKTNLLVFLRPYVVRSEATSSALALDRYDYIRGQVAAGSLPDTFIFRGMEGRQLPETPPKPPSMQRLPEPAPAPTAPDQSAPPGQPAPIPPPQPSTPPSPPPASAPPAPSTSTPAAGAGVGLGARAERERATPAPIVDVAPAAPPPVSAPAPAAPPPAPVTAAPPAAVSPPPAEPVAPSAPPPTAPPSVPPASAPPPAPMPAPAPSAPPPAATPAAPAVTPSTPPPAPAAAEPPTTAAPAAAAAGAVAPAAQPSGIQLLQVAAVSEIKRGRDLQRQLREAGFDAYWESVKTRKGDVVRVRVSVDTATQSVADTIAKLKAMGFDPIVVAP
jgi:general secretion pathway protein D